MPTTLMCFCNVSILHFWCCTHVWCCSTYYVCVSIACKGIQYSRYSINLCTYVPTCFSSGSIHHCWHCTPPTITKCPCCNPVLSTWYCRADCNSPPSTCIHILSYHWYSKADHLISSNQCTGYVIISLNLVFHCRKSNSGYHETWDTEGV